MNRKLNVVLFAIALFLTLGTSVAKADSDNGLRHWAEDQISAIGKRLTTIETTLTGLNNRLGKLEKKSSGYQYPESVKPRYKDINVVYQPDYHNLEATMLLENDYGQLTSDQCENGWMSIKFSNSAYSEIKSNLPYYFTEKGGGLEVPTLKSGEFMDININAVCYGQHFEGTKHYVVAAAPDSCKPFLQNSFGGSQPVEIGSNLTFSPSGITSAITWSGDGAAVKNSSYNYYTWTSYKSGQNTITASYKTSSGEDCSDTITVAVMDPVTKIESLAKIDLSAYTTFDATLNKDVARFTFDFKSQANSSLLYINRNWTLPMTTHLEVYKSVNWGQKGDLIMTKDLTNEQLWMLDSSRSRGFVIPLSDFGLTDADYTDGRANLIFEAKTTTPEQGDFTSTGSLYLTKI